MGRNLLAACIDDPALELAGALEHEGHEYLGRDAGELIGRTACGVRIRTTADEIPVFDVAVDFSRPEGTLNLVDLCDRRGAALVIGTTGFTGAQRATIGAAAQRIAIVLAPNMGVGVNLVSRLVEMAARALGDDYDVEVIEAHHRHKVDAPSGTALFLGEAAAAGQGRALADCAVYARHGNTGERARGTIGFCAIRGGDIVGEHTVLFAGPGERVEITHRAASRTVFAQGAMRAAAWVNGQGSGLYDMQDVLGLGA